MNKEEQSPEFLKLSSAVLELEDEVLPILKEIARHTLNARGAMGGRYTDKSTGEIKDTLTDTLTLSNEIVELSILIQRLGERNSEAGYIARAAKEYYERVREGHKVRLTTVGEMQPVTIKDKETGEDRVEQRLYKFPAGVADSMKVNLSTNEFALYNKCESLFEKITIARKATDKTVDAIRSKLSYEKSNDKNA